MTYTSTNDPIPDNDEKLLTAAIGNTHYWLVLKYNNKDQEQLRYIDFHRAEGCDHFNHSTLQNRYSMKHDIKRSELWGIIREMLMHYCRLDDLDNFVGESYLSKLLS